MKRPRFRLQALLHIKEHIEKEKQRALGVAIAKTLLQQEKLSRLQQEKEKLLGRQRETVVRPMSPAQMLGYSRYLLRLKRDELTSKEMLKALKQEEEKRRSDLLVATKEKKMLEKLKEKQESETLKHIEQTEMKLQDELSLAGFARRNT